MVVEILSQVATSLNDYFNTLSKFGYKKQKDVDRLLIYSFLEELLMGEARYYITEADYRTIERALTCLYGSSCLIPYPKFIQENALFDTRDIQISPRITEDSNLRSTEEYEIRFKASN